jgi:hypothetical protein
MRLVDGHRLLDQPGADEVEGFAFPGLVLPSVLRELAGAEAEAEGAEAAAGVDRGQLPVITDQDQLGLDLLGVLEQAGQLAAADHAGLVDHQHGAGIQLLVSSVKVGQESIAGGHLLEPLALQAHGGDPGRGRGQEPVAVQLPGMAGDAEREGLAGPGPADHQGNAGTALAQVPDHGLLVGAGAGMGEDGLTDRLMGDDTHLFARPAGGRGDEALLDPQQLRSGPAALLQGPVGDHADRPLGQEPVRQLFELGPGSPGSCPRSAAS